VDLESSCGGKGACGKCKVRPEAPPGAEDTSGLSCTTEPGVTPPTATEERKLGPEALAAGMRLACQTRVVGDVVVFVPEESRRTGQVVRKEAGARTVPLDPVVRRYQVTLAKPTLEDPTSDAERLLAALEAEHGLRGIGFDFRVLQRLPALLREADWDVAAIVWRNSVTEGAVIDVRPAADPRRILGLAVDVGTTTIAVYLTDLEDGRVIATESAVNPQVAMGDDVISRLYHATRDSDAPGQLQAAVCEQVNLLGSAAVERCDAAPQDVFDVVMVGNTAMHHLFLGLDVRALGIAPFVAAIQGSVDTLAANIGLSFHPGCRLHVLPVEAGFVGADNVAAVIAEEPYNQDDVLLIVDIGTNGELVLGNRQRMLSTSCATGPALEGAHIEFGMRAAMGAIERIRIDPETLDVRFKVIGLEGWSTEHPPADVKARGICGSGIIEAAAEMLACGVITPDGGFNPLLADLVNDRVVFEEGRPRKLVIARPEETAIGRAITVSLRDIRSVQLAKGALRAGAEILLHRYGIDKPDRVILAGAFGSYIDPQFALAIGMLPSLEPERVISVGNAAGDGARFALLNVEKRREASWVALAIEYVELATEPGFQREYLHAMTFSPLVRAAARG
jgi:uncharacterized 2Fe-2S/4Fe-4S cluster protein (DUF4445 family)